MKKFRASVIFYSWTNSTSDTKKIDKIRQFVRREHLSVDTDKYECIEHKLVVPDILLQSLKPFVQQDQLPSDTEHQYSISLCYSDAKKLHLAISLVQSYASYIGIHSRLCSFVCS